MDLDVARGEAKRIEYWVQVVVPYSEGGYIGSRENLAIFHDIVPHIPNVGEWVYVNTHDIYAPVVRRDFQYYEAFLDEETGEVKAPCVQVTLVVDEVDSE